MPSTASTRSLRMTVNKELVEMMSETISARTLAEMLLRSMQREERLKDDVTIYLNTIGELREQLDRQRDRICLACRHSLYDSTKHELRCHKHPRPESVESHRVVDLTHSCECYESPLSGCDVSRDMASSL